MLQLRQWLSSLTFSHTFHLSFGPYPTLQYTCNFPVRMFASEDLVETRQRERRTVLFQILQVESSVLESVTIFRDIQGPTLAIQLPVLRIGIY